MEPETSTQELVKQPSWLAGALRRYADTAKLAQEESAGADYLRNLSRS